MPNIINIGLCSAEKTTMASCLGTDQLNVIEATRRCVRGVRANVPEPERLSNTCSLVLLAPMLATSVPGNTGYRQRIQNPACAHSRVKPCDAHDQRAAKLTTTRQYQKSFVSCRHLITSIVALINLITMGIRSRVSITSASAAALFLTQVLLFIVVLEVRDCDGFVPVHIIGWTDNYHHTKPPSSSSFSSSSLLFLQPQQLGSFEPLAVSPVEIEKRRVVLQNWLTTSPITTSIDNDTASQTQSPQIDFQDAWNVQKDLVQQHVDRLQRLDDESKSQEDLCKTSSSLPSSFLHDNDDQTNVHCGVDTVILLQHAPVYTLGTASDESFILDQQQQNDNLNDNDHNNKACIPTVRMDRGGEVTYHGPGQLTVYPILDLRNYQQDIHWYCRALEEAVMIALADCGITTAYRDEETTGVWVDNYKVAAVGIKCRRWITVHGVAINVEDCSLTGFADIVPCGLTGRRVGCVNQFLREQQPQRSPLTVREFAVYMESALEEVFCMRLVDADRSDAISETLM
jgi:lipoyl(octanoyl) transferase